MQSKVSPTQCDAARKSCFPAVLHRGGKHAMPAMITRRRSVMAGAIAVASSSCLAAARSAMAAEPDMGLRTPLPTQAPMTEALADLGKVKLWYWGTGGSGEVVVFLHPGSGSAEFFPYQQPAFAKVLRR